MKGTLYIEESEARGPRNRLLPAPRGGSCGPLCCDCPPARSERMQLHTFMVQTSPGQGCSVAATQPLTQVPRLSLSLPRTPTLAGEEHLARKSLPAQGVNLGWISRLN